MNFLIKSTNPGQVFGDAWGNEEALGMKRPVPPEAPKPPELKENATTEELEEHAKATQRHQESLPAYEVAVKTFHEEAAIFKAKFEAARQQVDRMAKSGVVPVNFYEGDPGDFLVPAEGPNDTITAIAVKEADITIPQYLRCIGKITRVLPDGRREVEVKVV